LPFIFFNHKSFTMTRLLICLLSISIGFLPSCAEPPQDSTLQLAIADTASAAGDEKQLFDANIVPAAERMELYLPLLQGKKIGVFANHTSLVKSSNLVDTLLKKGINVTVVFGPEHGFRGTADAGEKIGNYTDEKTGVPVVSLYGSKHKPSPEDLKNVEVMVFDIQDVGTRFYTYISSMQEYMEAAIENDKSLIILDRPNPNGFYVDGPMLDTNFRSFVGMQEIPVVYGLTIGEYANYLVGEQGFKNKFMITDKRVTKNDSLLKLEIGTIQDLQKQGELAGSASLNKIKKTLSITIIKCAGYTHKSKYALPVKPSPNLPDMSAIYWYASTCLFEGTALSEGRGTDKPFQLFGHPSLPKNLVSFTPVSKPGAGNPKLKDKLCYGWDLSGSPQAALKRVDNKMQIKYLLEAYRLFPEKDSFFRRNGSSFNRLAGSDMLMKQIKQGLSEEEIRKSWEPDLKKYLTRRKEYLLYEDF
jgi:uncharacterized protein YbbC (DUF1343 family)